MHDVLQAVAQVCSVSSYLAMPHGSDDCWRWASARPSAAHYSCRRVAWSLTACHSPGLCARTNGSAQWHKQSFGLLDID